MGSREGRTFDPTRFSYIISVRSPERFTNEDIANRRIPKSALFIQYNRKTGDFYNRRNPAMEYDDDDDKDDKASVTCDDNPPSPASSFKNCTSSVDEYPLSLSPLQIHDANEPCVRDTSANTTHPFPRPYVLKLNTCKKKPTLKRRLRIQQRKRFQKYLSPTACAAFSAITFITNTDFPEPPPKPQRSEKAVQVTWEDLLQSSEHLEKLRKRQSPSPEPTPSPDDYNYECSVCKKKFKKLSHFRDHTESHKSATDRKKWNCNYCPKFFLTSNGLFKHNKNNHFDKLGCKTCEICFKSEEDLNTHNQTPGNCKAEARQRFKQRLSKAQKKINKRKKKATQKTKDKAEQNNN